MIMTITKSASEELNKKIGDQKGYLKIQYVTEGLACGAGVPTLFFIPSEMKPKTFYLRLMIVLYCWRNQRSLSLTMT